ncbi:MAG: SUF system NifU family Fe-S cluster assembly protein [Gemmatimonadales bacterium]|nr:SUF system NifU family Fe-S cluster assembly protein [Gemmatimonadales bacterium]
MADLADLYQQIIIDHNRNPRNFKHLDDANRTAHGDNPLCGDKITLYVHLDGEVISDVGFQGSGCAISQASASLMTSAVKGKTTADAEALFHAFHAMVMGETGAAGAKALGKLAAFAGVRQFPARVKCANLPWHTLHAAVTASAEPVTTE